MKVDECVRSFNRGHEVQEILSMILWSVIAPSGNRLQLIHENPAVVFVVIYSNAVKDLAVPKENISCRGHMGLTSDVISTQMKNGAIEGHIDVVAPCRVQAIAVRLTQGDTVRILRTRS